MSGVGGRGMWMRERRRGGKCEWCGREGNVDGVWGGEGEEEGREM